MVEYFDVMDEFCASLNSEKSGHNVRIEEILDPEVALESLVVEVVKILLDTLRVAGLSEREIFIVGKLAEVLAHHIFEVVDHSRNRLYFIGVDLLCLDGFVTPHCNLLLITDGFCASFFGFFQFLLLFLN